MLLLYLIVSLMSLDSGMLRCALLGHPHHVTRVSAPQLVHYSSITKVSLLER